MAEGIAFRNCAFLLVYRGVAYNSHIAKGQSAGSALFHIGDFGVIGTFGHDGTVRCNWGGDSFHRSFTHSWPRNGY